MWEGLSQCRTSPLGPRLVFRSIWTVISIFRRAASIGRAYICMRNSVSWIKRLKRFESRSTSMLWFDWPPLLSSLRTTHIECKILPRLSLLCPLRGFPAVHSGKMRRLSYTFCKREVISIWPTDHRLRVPPCSSFILGPAFGHVSTFNIVFLPPSSNEHLQYLIIHNRAQICLGQCHQWLSELVTQYWFSMYYSSRDI
jgi:hypothetical protein